MALCPSEEGAVVRAQGGGAIAVAAHISREAAVASQGADEITMAAGGLENAVATAQSREETVVMKGSEEIDTTFSTTPSWGETVVAAQNSEETVVAAYNGLHSVMTSLDAEGTVVPADEVVMTAQIGREAFATGQASEEIDVNGEDIVAKAQSREDIVVESQGGEETCTHMPTCTISGELSKWGICPGAVVALRNDYYRCFVKMSDARMERDPVLESGQLAANWRCVGFQIVDAGQGQIALYNCVYKRFIKMGSSGMKTTRARAANRLSAGVRFTVVLCAKGQIALHNSDHNRFIQMGSDSIVRTNKQKRLGQDSRMERFAVVVHPRFALESVANQVATPPRDDKVIVTALSVEGTPVFGPESLDVATSLQYISEQIFAKRRQTLDTQVVTSIQLLYGERYLKSYVRLQELSSECSIELTAVLIATPVYAGCYEGYRDNPDDSHEEWTVTIQVDGVVTWYYNYYSAYDFYRTGKRRISRGDFRGGREFIARLNFDGECQVELQVAGNTYRGACDRNGLKLQESSPETNFGGITLVPFDEDKGRRRRPLNTQSRAFTDFADTCY